MIYTEISRVKSKKDILSPYFFMHLASGSGNGVSGDNSNNTNLDES